MLLVGSVEDRECVVFGSRTCLKRSSLYSPLSAEPCLVQSATHPSIRFHHAKNHIGRPRVLCAHGSIKNNCGCREAKCLQNPINVQGSALRHLSARAVLERDGCGYCTVGLRRGTTEEKEQQRKKGGGTAGHGSGNSGRGREVFSESDSVLYQ